jgi:hypothetical protein
MPGASTPSKRVIDEPPMARITEQRRPDRGTIGGSSADRDYRMSTYDNAIRRVRLERAHLKSGDVYMTSISSYLASCGGIGRMQLLS